jgi:acyl transferase domain-containing protein
VRLTGFFECHGTGTVLGDPLEVEAISKAMNRRRRPEDGPLVIGAVKTGIGHGEAVSGLSSLIKAVLAVERGIIPSTRGLPSRLRLSNGKLGTLPCQTPPWTSRPGYQ